MTLTLTLDSGTSKVQNALSLDEFLVSCRLHPDKLQVINFWTPWVESCVEMNKAFAALATNNPEIGFWDADAEAIADLALHFRIEAVPTFIFVRGEREVARVDGAKVEELGTTLAKLKSTLPTLIQAEPLNERLKKLINQHPFMIFIKGSPKMPRCGFTQELLELLDEEKIEYDYFDILQNDEVRQGLKVYSNWPTYPQIYVKGELIGGLDIFQELVETKQINSILGRAA